MMFGWSLLIQMKRIDAMQYRLALDFQHAPQELLTQRLEELNTITKMGFHGPLRMENIIKAWDRRIVQLLHLLM